MEVEMKRRRRFSSGTFKLTRGQLEGRRIPPYFSMAHFLFLFFFFGKLKVGLNVQRSTPADYDIPH